MTLTTMTAISELWPYHAPKSFVRRDPAMKLPTQPHAINARRPNRSIMGMMRAMINMLTRNGIQSPRNAPKERKFTKAK
jgi:hypothetical protein